MKKLTLFFIKRLRGRQLYLKYFSSIGFIPSATALFFVVSAFLMIYLDKAGFGHDLLKNMPLLVTRKEDTAVGLLTILIGGMFSLLVFSFTMVMVILTTVTSNYTPRALPGLINNKSHQVVLGLYLGTIFYLIIIFINIGKEGFQHKVPDLSVLVSVLSVIVCLLAFVYFIHSISQNVQAGNILNSLYLDTLTHLQKEADSPYSDEIPATDGWCTIKSPKTGYFQGMNGHTALEFSVLHDIQLVILPEKGRFLLKGTPFAMISRELPPETIAEFQEQIDYYFQEHIAVNYLFGFKHITEVAVKALSPGINDPATAIIGIDYLTDLFCNLIIVGRYKLVKDSKNIIRLYYRQAYFEKVFYFIFSSIRNYATKDVVVQTKLLFMLDELQQYTSSDRYRDFFIKEREALLENAKQGFSNTRDLEALFDGIDPE